MRPELRLDPVVCFMARSVHLLLQCRLSRKSGLADRRVRMVDPAAGAYDAAAWVLAEQEFPLDAGQRISLLRQADSKSLLADLSGGIPVFLGKPEGDYVKFLRLAQSTIDQLGRGVAALVVDHNCLTAPSFRGLRQSLVQHTFNEIYALDLARTVDGEENEEVIPDGSALLFLVKYGGFRARVFLADLGGTKEEKLRLLWSSDLSTMNWKEVPTRVPVAFRPWAELNVSPRRLDCPRQRRD